MELYFSLDPLLRSVFVSLTPDQDFPDLCERVPPSLTSALLNQNIHASTKFQEDNLKVIPLQHILLRRVPCGQIM